jgi:hypothetical protein
MTWPAFCDWIAAQAAAQYPAPRNDSKAAREAAKARLLAIVCAPFSGSRSNDTVGDHTALVCDVDDVPDLDTLLDACSRFRCVVYESPSSTDAAPRLRIIAALQQPYPAHGAPEARATFARELGLDPIASGVSKAAAPAQIMFIGGFRGTPQRRTWVFEGDVWVPPESGSSPELAPAEGAPTEPLYGADHIPDLSRLVTEIEPEKPGGLRRGGRDISRAVGGWLARRGFHPEAIAEAVLQLPSDQPGVRAEQARETAEQFYAGDVRAAGYATLEGRFGAEVMAELDDAVTDPWVKMMAAQWPPPRPLASVAEASPAPDGATAEAALAALPEWVSDHVRAAQEELRTPLGLNLANAIGTLACATSGRLKLRLTHTYACHTCLFVCSVASSGQLKSPAFRLASAPIMAWVAEQQDAEREDLQRKLNDRELKTKKRVKLLTEQLATWAEYDDPPQSPELTKISVELAAPAPVPFEFLVQDVTPEALSDLLATHGRIACLSSEAGKIFSVLAGHYSGVADLGVWNEAYDGDMKKVHRKGKPPIVPLHAQTTLSAVLSIQHSVLENITGNVAMVDEGLVQRMCWVVCEDVDQRWAPGEIPTSVPAEVAETWEAGVRHMLGVSGEVRLSADAFETYIAWRDELEARKKTDLGGEVFGWGSKHLERTARIAAVLWAADGAGETSPVVTGEQMARAVTIGRWLIPHAVRALQGGDTTSDEAAVLRSLGKRALKTAGDMHGWVVRKDLQRHLTPKRLRTKKVFTTLVEDLVGRGALDADADLGKFRVPLA